MMEMDVDAGSSSGGGVEGMVDIGPDAGHLLKRRRQPGITPILPRTGDAVTITYVLRHGDRILEDRSQGEGHPLTFTLGHQQVIKGFDLAVATMTAGEIADLVIHPAYAQGLDIDTGNLTATIKLLSVDRQGDVGTYEERDTRLHRCMELKGHAATLCKEGCWKHALAAYKYCVNTIKFDVGDKDAAALCSTLHVNMAICHNKLNNTHAALESAQEALQCSEGNVKAWYHRAAAQLRLNRLDDAKHSIDSALALDPHNKSAKALRSKIDAALTRSDERAKRMYKQMFASPSSA